jgi:hypothetical protein
VSSTRIRRRVNAPRAVVYRALLEEAIAATAESLVRLGLLRDSPKTAR